MKIAGLVKSSFVDYPGLPACVLFVPECNYDCFYCHNRQLLGATSPNLPPDEIAAFLIKRVTQLDAVVVTGGEPTLQPDLIPFLLEVKALGYRVKLDTNGSSPEVIEQALQQNACDYYAVDYKAPQSRYPEICGGSADAGCVLITIDLLLQAKAEFEVRITVIPQLSQDDLLQMARELPVVPRFILNRYRKPDNYKPDDEERVKQTPYTQAEIAAMAEVLRKLQPGVVC
ncbi:MAG: anaerobic ribonucleoside-triphosphate reductase activating protein [Candidatus Limiplasma sp.]|nr:anaerobic ribonucleoside-triphosphate reductase activating protein [Candidatus Limiplasma sp.]